MAVITKGRALPLTDADLRETAAQYGLTEAHVRAVMEVESRGKGFAPDGSIVLLTERHVFYRELKGQSAKLRAAVDAGLAATTGGGYPKGNAAVLRRFQAMAAIDETAAILSSSWGLGQVMGFNHKRAGYSTPQAMLAAFVDSERAQLVGMLEFIKTGRLVRHLVAGDWHAFAEAYNGSNQEKNDYEGKLKRAFDKWSKKLLGAAPAPRKPRAKPVVPTDPMLKMGSRGDLVETLQNALVSKGYFPGAVDKAFGKNTRAAVLEWKADNGLPLTPDFDTATLLSALVSGPAKERRDVTKKEVVERSKTAWLNDLLVKGGGGLLGSVTVANGLDVSGIVQTVQEKAGQIKEAKDSLDTLVLAVGSPIAALVKAVSNHTGLILFAAVLVAMGVAWYTLRSRVADERAGKTLSP